MSYKPGDTATIEFVTSSATGAATNADSLPAGTVNHNGTDDGTVTVAITALDAGRYKAVFTIPGGYVSGDSVNLSIAATVGGIAAKGAHGPWVLSAGRPTFTGENVNAAISAAPDSPTVAKLLTMLQGAGPYAFTEAALANTPESAGGPTAAQIATAVWQDLLSGSDFTTAGSIGKQLASLTLAAIAAAAIGGGTGPVSITNNTPTTGFLTCENAQGVGIGGASVLVYLASDWPANPANVQASGTTQLDGSWGPLFVNHGTYVVVFNKVGVGGPMASASITV